MPRGWVVNATHRPLYPLERNPAPIVQDGWAPEPLWTDAKNQSPTGISSPDFPASSESLYRLGYPGPRMKNNAQSLFKPLKPAINANSMGVFSSYFTEKTFRLYYKNQRLFLFNEIIIVYFESHVKHINTLCKKRAE